MEGWGSDLGFFKAFQVIPLCNRGWESHNWKAKANVCVCVFMCLLSSVWLFPTSWTVAHQAPLSMGFPRQEYWSGFPFLPPGDLPNAGIESTSPAFPVLAGRFFATLEAQALIYSWSESLFRFSATSNRKTWMNFLANPIPKRLLESSC